MRAQSSVEYGMLIALVAILVLLTAYHFGQALQEWFLSIVGALPMAAPGVPDH